MRREVEPPSADSEAGSSLRRRGGRRSGDEGAWEARADKSWPGKGLKRDIAGWK